MTLTVTTYPPNLIQLETKEEKKLCEHSWTTQIIAHKITYFCGDCCARTQIFPGVSDDD